MQAYWVWFGRGGNQFEVSGEAGFVEERRDL